MSVLRKFAVSVSLRSCINSSRLKGTGRLWTEGFEVVGDEIGPLEEEDFCSAPLLEEEKVSWAELEFEEKVFRLEGEENVFRLALLLLEREDNVSRPELELLDSNAWLFSATIVLLAVLDALPSDPDDPDVADDEEEEELKLDWELSDADDSLSFVPVLVTVVNDVELMLDPLDDRCRSWLWFRTVKFGDFIFVRLPLLEYRLLWPSLMRVGEWGIPPGDGLRGERSSDPSGLVCTDP